MTAQENLSEVDFVVVGAGSAGLSAAKALQDSGRSFVVLEASHRIGGRAYTEELRPGEPFDLGAHWIHSASLNPFTQIAKDFGINTLVEHDTIYYEGGKKLSKKEIKNLENFVEGQYGVMRKALDGKSDLSAYQSTDREHRFTPWFDYYFVQEYTADVDQVSTEDVLSYVSTDDEDIALKEGFGTLLSRFGSDVPVSLNSPITRVDWSGPKVLLTTPKGTLSAKAVVITVSTGVLAGGDIGFSPALPLWKHEAIANLPMGNSNRICLGFKPGIFDLEAHTYIAMKENDDEPAEMVVRPFGFDYVEFVTGGRFADWLEKAGDAAAIDFATKKVQAIFGQDVAKHVDKHITTAWRGDTWTKGTYAYAKPGQAGQRAKLAEPVDNKLYFAGEACSLKHQATVHGAYLTGKAVVEALLSDHPL